MSEALVATVVALLLGSLMAASIWVLVCVLDSIAYLA